MADGTNMKKMIETQITCTANANLEAKANENFRRMTVYTLAYRLQGQIVWLNKKGKHIRPDKVSICKICGVSTADVDLCTVSNNGASGVAS